MERVQIFVESTQGKDILSRIKQLVFPDRFNAKLTVRVFNESKEGVGIRVDDVKPELLTTQELETAVMNLTVNAKEGIRVVLGEVGIPEKKVE